MNPFFEKVYKEEGVSLAVLDRRLDSIPFGWHHHPEFQLTLTLNSRGHRYAGDAVDPYDDEDLVLLAPGVPHSWCSNEIIDANFSHQSIIVWFTRDWADRLISFAPELSPITILLNRSQGVLFSKKVASELKDKLLLLPSVSAAQRFVDALDIFIRLSLDDQASDIETGAWMRGADAGADPRIEKITQHLQSNISEVVRIEALAEMACLSASAFQRAFYKQVRMTPVQYLTRLRIGRACSMLIGSRQSIASIMEQIGYSNTSLFNRQFRKLKAVTPREFRKMHWREDVDADTTKRA
jgi:AraC-like DNA-binding protein